MTTTTGVGVRRILFKEITAADVRKFRAESNDAATGGGARDLRLPYSEFDSIIQTMFPRSRSVTRRRNGVPTEVNVRVGDVTYMAQDSDEPVDVTVEMTWEPPTDARPREGRLPRVHEKLTLPEEGYGRVFFMLVQDENNRIGAHYAYEDDLRAGAWRTEVATPILKCLDDPDRKKKSVQGYLDYTTNHHFCHGVD